MSEFYFASRSTVARFASALTMFALVATPFMALMPATAKAVAPPPPTPSTISIDSVEDDGGSYSSPFTFSCPANGNAGEITISGSGTGEAPPGQIQQYAVAIDWGDGSATTTGLGTFTPPSGTSAFTYTFTGSHTYTSYGSKTVKAILYHQNINGNDNPAETTITLAPCDPNPEPSVTTDAADNISDTDATMHGTNGPVAATNSSYWVSLAPIDTSSPSMPSGVYSTPTQGGVSAGGSLAPVALSLVTTSGIPGNLPGGIQPNTTYYYVAWVYADGEWHHGENMTVTTLPDPNEPPACDLGAGTTFDTLSLGNVNGQGGWTSTGAFDQEIVANTYGYPTFGCKSLRISNAVTSGSFGDQTFSYSVANEAGETIAENNGMSGGTRQERFVAQFDIGTTKPDSHQTGLAVTASPDRGDGARMGYLRFEDSAGGIDVYFYDVQGFSDPANFVQTQIANDLPRGTAHTVKFVMDFVDGPLQAANAPANDVVEIYIDGILVHTGTSWENYYRYDNESNPALVDTSRTVDSLLFRVAGTAAPANDGEGFLFDNFSIETGPTPGEPVETSTVTLCKYADTYPENTPLQGWTLSLSGDEVGAVSVLPTGDAFTIPAVPAGSYFLTASGEYVYRSTVGAENSDAQFSERDPGDSVYGGPFAPWVDVNTFPNPNTGWLGVMVNDSFTNWGSTFNPAHEYTIATTTVATSDFVFRILDDQYGDNSGQVDVSIDYGYTGVTGANGCVTFTGVPHGDYVFSEENQEGWEPVDSEESDLGEVVVDSETETFNAINHNDEFGAKSCVLVSDATTLEGGTASDLVPEPHHESWTAVVDALAYWIWGDEEVDDPTSEETQTFTKTFWLDTAPAADATLVIAADNAYDVELNGTPVATDANEDNYTNAGKDTVTIPMGEFNAGANTLVFMVKNFAMDGGSQATNPAGLNYKLTIPGTECEQTPPDQNELQVHIYKYILDENDEIELASTTTDGSFPMSATWNANNIGAGSGNYALNPGNSYHAATSPMSQQADYSTYEITDGSVVVPANSETCPADKYRLVGYKTGNTLIEAENDNIDDDFPVFTSLDADKYIIVVNEDCDELDIPPTEQIQVHIYKYLTTEEGIAQVPNDSEIPPFDMTATWKTSNLNGGATTSAGYVLGNNHGGTALKYAADTSPMDVPANYTTSEVTGENGILPIDGTCVEGAYRLVGYKTGVDLDSALLAPTTDEAPEFYGLDADQTVIVINEDCDDVDEGGDPTPNSQTIVVSPADMNGWSIMNFDNSDLSDDDTTTVSGTQGTFVTGPTGQPLGSGSYQQDMGTDGDDANRIWTSDFNGVQLADIEEFVYSTYVDQNNGAQAAYIQLRLDRDADGTWDDALFFEPVYQNGAYGMLYGQPNVPNQCAGDPNCVILDTWQSWDAEAGGWWSNLDSAGGPPITTLAAYVAQYPNTILATDVPSLRVQTGFGGAAWQNFIGSADELIIRVNDGVTDMTTTYDFEPSAQGESQFTITSTVDGDGTISPLGAVVVNQGDSQIFTFTDGGDVLDFVLVDGVDIGAPNDYTFSNVTENHTIHASFKSNGGTGGGASSNSSVARVLGASTDESSSTCSPLLSTYMRLGMTNDTQDVTDLQGFLNSHIGTTLPVNGMFGADTDAAVKTFQSKYKAEVLDPWIPFGFTGAPTGYVFKTTKWKINNLVCPGSEAMPLLP